MNEFHYYSNDSDPRTWLNELGKYLRDSADEDYIASRSLYRRGLITHSAYLGHQSIEKYFKAILIFLKKSTRAYGHDIIKLKDACELGGVKLKDSSLEAVSLLSGLHNVSRYRSGNFEIQHHFLFCLDYFVKDIRPYVQNRYAPEEILKKTKNPKNIMSGHDLRGRFVIFSGRLEQILRSEKNSEKMAKQDLIWNNLYFGLKKKKKVKMWRGFSARYLPFGLDNRNDLELGIFLKKYFKFEPDIEVPLREYEKSI